MVTLYVTVICVPELPPCSVAECPNLSRTDGSRGGALLCKKHYHRQYRHGDVAKTAWGSGINKPVAKYRRVSSRGHPLADKYGLVWEHRAVLYNKIGATPQQCHHCGKQIVWFVVDPVKNDPRLIFVDHLDNNGGNNKPDNLVPSCFSCNQARGQTRRRQALVEEGWWSNNDTVAKTGRGRVSRFEDD